MVESFITAYCTHLEAEGEPPKTIEWHRHGLGKFAAWLRGNDQPPDPSRWTAATTRVYLVHLKPTTAAEGRLLAPHSVKSYGSSLRSFCRWLPLEEHAPRDPMERVKQAMAPRLAKPALSSDEVRRLLAPARSAG